MMNSIRTIFLFFALLVAGTGSSWGHTIVPSTSSQDLFAEFAEVFSEVRPLAEQGDASAQYQLGTMYEFGYGVPQDYIRALMWFNLAEANFAETGEKKSVRNVIDYIEEKMTPAQIEQAQELAQECVRKEYKGC